MLTLSAATDAAPCHEAAYLGTTFLSWSWIEGQVFQFAGYWVARRGLCLWWLRKQKKSYRKVLMFLSNLKSPICSSGTVRPHTLTRDVMLDHSSKESICSVSLQGHCFNRDLWWVTSMFHPVRHLPQDTSSPWATKQAQRGRTVPGRFNQIPIFLWQKSGHWPNQGFNNLLRRWIICPQNL